MQGYGERAFGPGYRRFRVLHGRVPAYVVVGRDGRVVASDRDAWLRFNWKTLRRRLEGLGATVEELNGEGDGQDGAA